jgi:prepilin-type N-terminal cleavage/methylation domain-containing protein
MSSKKEGFTLIELLVVVAIIGVLASVVMVSLNSARAKGRDARRMSDIKQIQNAIELYISDYGEAPDIFAVDYDKRAGNSNDWDTLSTLLSPYIPQLPKDPCGASSTSPCEVINGNFYGNWLAYVYMGPNYLQFMQNVAGYEFNTPIDNNSYAIMAENLEVTEKSFISGPYVIGGVSF